MSGSWAQRSTAWEISKRLLLHESSWVINKGWILDYFFNLFFSTHISLKHFLRFVDLLNGLLISTGSCLEKRDFSSIFGRLRLSHCATHWCLVKYVVLNKGWVEVHLLRRVNYSPRVGRVVSNVYEVKVFFRTILTQLLSLLTRLQHLRALLFSHR